MLAVCKQESGCEEARRRMRYGLISAVNLSEVYASATRYRKLALAEAIMKTAELEIVPFDKKHAMIAAELEGVSKKFGISFADRACLALGICEQKPVLTGDHKWGSLALELKLEFFRPKPN